MKQFFEFCLQHWDFISSIILVIASVVIMAIKKKPVLNAMDNILIEVFSRLPEWINSAEALKGAEVKKALVLESAKKFVKDQFSMDLPESYISLIGEKVEAILSTPQKH